MKKILLIEDNTDVRENTAEILELSKYAVVTAANGKEGVRLAHSEKPDLIICDIMMPELDGYGVLHMLSKDTATAGIPFIFLTAKAEKADYRKGMVMGADDYITKPFDDTDLLNAVETRLKKSDVMKAEYAATADGLNSFIGDVKGLDDLKKISEKRESKLYKKKEIIYSENTYPKGVYFIVKGKVKIFKTNAEGKEYIISLHKDGEFIGYASLLEEAKYAESAEVMEDTELILIPKEDFYALLFSNRDVAHKFIKLLSNNLIDKEEKLLKLAYNSVRKRVAEALIMLHEKYKESNDQKFSMAISRDDIARMVGTATETVIRTLSDFKEEKLIEIKGSNITIINADKLEKMKN